MFKSLIVILISSVLIDNYVLRQTIGICPFLGVSKKLNQSVGMGLSVTLVMIIATIVTWPIETFILNRFNLGYMQTIVFILVIAALVQAIEIFLKKFIPSLHKGLGVYLPLITTNCAVLGITLDNIKYNFSFLESVVSALGCGIGFLLAMVLFSGLRSRIEDSAIPKSFRGLACTLIAASFISLAFFGFDGVVDNIPWLAGGV